MGKYVTIEGMQSLANYVIHKIKSEITIKWNVRNP